MSFTLFLNCVIASGIVMRDPAGQQKPYESEGSVLRVY